MGEKMRRFRTLICAFAGAGLMCIGAGAFGATATDTQAAAAGATSFTPTYTPSSTDLINGLAPSAQAGTFNLESSGGIPVLTDGVFGSIGTGVTGAHPAFATGGPSGGTSLTYSLNTAASPAGYDLSSIVSYGGWNDAGRDQQSYVVSYSTVASPALFVPIATVNYNPPNPDNTPSATRVTITPDVGSILASGVAAVNFSFANPVENGYTGYAEFDVFGTASVPEPGSLGVVVMSAFGLLSRRARAR
jgi:hypothetical protein